MMEIIPAILTDSVADLKEKLEETALFAEEVQIDFFDSVFVPGYSGPSPGDFLKISTGLRLIAHILAFEPENLIAPLKDSGFTKVIFHIETTAVADNIIETARDLDLEVGVAIAPATDISELRRFAGRVEEYMFLAADPREPGVFIPETLERVRRWRMEFPELTISVDGGLDAGNIAAVKTAGADIAYVGNAIFRAGDWAERYQQLVKIIRKTP